MNLEKAVELLLGRVLSEQERGDVLAELADDGDADDAPRTAPEQIDYLESLDEKSRNRLLDSEERVTVLRHFGRDE